MEKSADLIVTILQNGNLIYEWWCSTCRTYHDSIYCPFIDFHNNSYDDDFYYSMS